MALKGNLPKEDALLKMAISRQEMFEIYRKAFLAPWSLLREILTLTVAGGLCEDQRTQIGFQIFDTLIKITTI